MRRQKIITALQSRGVRLVGEPTNPPFQGERRACAAVALERAMAETLISIKEISGPRVRALVPSDWSRGQLHCLIGCKLFH